MLGRAWLSAFAQAVLACALFAGSFAQAALVTTKHNLAASGPGTVKATTEARICIFCHTPHNAAPSGPLWNHKNSSTAITPYASSTNVSSPGQPTGGSILCLSCHDGTIALGDVLSVPTRITMAGGVTTMPATSASRLGTDLSGDHPFSFAYTPALVTARGGELANPSTLATGPVRLDSTGQLQCTSCHDPHNDPYGKFLVMSNTASALCNVCHIKNYWSSSDHNLSTSTWNGTAPNPWPHTSGTTVAANGCEGCHRPHTAPFKKWLQNVATEEGTCYPCHNGNVAPKTYKGVINVQAEFNKVSRHDIALTTGVHDAAEANQVTTKHVECVDCHNPHASNGSTGALPGSLIGVKGVDINNVAVTPAVAGYQICFRCHGDTAATMATQYTPRQIAQMNTRVEFNTGNPSFHPIAGPGKSANVPSLIAPWTISSTMKCEDCHNNNSGTNNGGTGPKGPHASTNPILMERPYARGTTPTAGDICYKCHLQSTVTREPPHNRSEHLRYGCGACHEPHGISSTQGNSTNNSRLINLSSTDTKAIGTGATAKWYIDTTNKWCYLSCHGESHNGCMYGSTAPPGGAGCN